MSMLRRLLPLILVLFVAAAPVALELCEVHCAEPAAHSCPHAPARDEAVTTLSAVPHACGHAEEPPAIGVPGAQVVAAMPAIMSVIATIVPAATTVAHFIDGSPPGDPVPLALRTPLRV
jgi:hypothetical protein